MNIKILGGGCFSHVRNHLSLCAMAFGTTARDLKQQLPFAELILTKMANPNSKIITNEDVKLELDKQLADPNTGIIIMNAALCDFDGSIGDVESGSHATRLESRNAPFKLTLEVNSKLISHIKEARADVVIVGFKTTTGATELEMLEKAERMEVDICIANDTVTRKNLLVISEDCDVEYKGLNLFGSRKGMLNMLSLFCLELQGNIREETSKHIVVDLEVKNYITKTVAFEKAVEYSGVHQENFCTTKSHWSTKEEGVFILSKIKEF